MKQIKVSQHPQYGAFTVLAILVPLIGLIAGIVMATKDKVIDKKLGSYTIVLSIVFMAVWSVVFLILLATVFNQPTSSDLNQYQEYINSLQ